MQERVEAGYLPGDLHWFGSIALATHLGCGLRMVLREHNIPERLADFAPRIAVAGGVVVSSLILVALLGVRAG